MTEAKRHLGVMARVALLVASGDWLTKAVAVRAVGDEPLVFSERLRFAVHHNSGTVFGWSAGAYTWELNLGLTLAAILFMVPVTRELARIDAAAPKALGLIVGGALGNFASLALSPPGVVDFISVATGGGSELVLNVADVAAYVGLAMIARTGFLIVAELRRTATVGRAVAVIPQRAIAAAAFSDREVAVPVGRDTGTPVDVADILVPRPESVRRAEVADLAISDPKVIDIRPRLARGIREGG